MTRLFPLCLLLPLLFVSACTTVGVHDEAARQALDYGPPVTVNLCLLKDESLNEAVMPALLAALEKEMAPFAITIDIPWTKPWKRQGFSYENILQSVVQAQALEAPCDRIMALVGRDGGDVIWGLLLMPEVLGAVETVTHTRGFSVGEIGSVNQIFSGPSGTFTHEFYHMLGCVHGLTLEDCYHRIIKLKAEVRRLREKGNTFIPGINGDQFLETRGDVDALLARVNWGER